MLPGPFVVHPTRVGRYAIIAPAMEGNGPCRLPMPPRHLRASVRSLVCGDAVSARTFEDSAGTQWEVFEVQRSSSKAQAVSVGLERGWLSFVCRGQKRRLAPIPPDWKALDDAELERLCGVARVVRSAPLALESAAVEQPASPAASRPRGPRIQPPRVTPETAADELPIVGTATSADSVEDTVREFAHQARSSRLPAIEAMVRLKALLAQVYADPASPARDLRAVRRWFVDAYYFERADAAPDAADQSR